MIAVELTIIVACVVISYAVGSAIETSGKDIRAGLQALADALREIDEP